MPPYKICHVLVALSLAASCGDPETPPGGSADPAAAAPSSSLARPTAGYRTSQAGGDIASLTSPAPSPIVSAAARAKLAFDSPKRISNAVLIAESLVEYATNSPKAADANAALAWSAYLRLLAVGASAGLQTGPAARALGGDGAQARQLRLALAATNKVKASGATITGLNMGHVELAVRALLGSDANEKAIEFDRRSALQLAAGGSAEGMAMRAAFLVRLEGSLRSLREQASELRFFAFARQSGRIMCAGCSDAHHVTPDNVTRFLLNGRKNRGGVFCDEAFDLHGVTTKTSPALEIARARKCAPVFSVAQQVEDNAWWGANGLALATLATAHSLMDAPVEASPLVAAVRKRVAAMRLSLDKPVTLPVPAVVTPPPAVSGERPVAGGVAAMTGLGFGGLTVAREPLEVYQLATDGVRAGLRTVVSYDAMGVLRSLTARKAAGSLLLLPIEALGPGGTKKDRGGSEALAEGARRVHAAATKLARRHKLLVSKGDDRGAIAEVIVDAEASAAHAITLIEALKVAGYGHFRFTKTTAHGRTLPLVVRTAPAALVARLKPGFKRPLIAVVYGDHVDLWAPRGATAAARKPDLRHGLPVGIEAGSRGGTLVRLRVNVPPNTKGLHGRSLVMIEKGLKFLQLTRGAGPLAHIVAAPGARAADVLRVARAFQERRARGEIDNPQSVWSETSCGGKSYVANKKQPEGCPTGVAIAFSRIQIPAGRGISSRIIESKKKKKKKKKLKSQPKVAHAPSRPAGRCNSANISTVMAYRRGAFRVCYEKELRANKGIAGRVVLGFTIGLDGRIQNARVHSSTLKSHAVHTCLLAKLKTARFSKPDSGVCQVKWPLKFQEK